MRPAPLLLAGRTFLLVHVRPSWSVSLTSSPAAASQSSLFAAFTAALSRQSQHRHLQLTSSGAVAPSWTEDPVWAAAPLLEHGHRRVRQGKGSLPLSSTSQELPCIPACLLPAQWNLNLAPSSLPSGSHHLTVEPCWAGPSQRSVGSSWAVPDEKAEKTRAGGQLQAANLPGSELHSCGSVEPPVQ